MAWYGVIFLFMAPILTTLFEKNFELWDVLGYLKESSFLSGACLLNQLDEFDKRKNAMFAIDKHSFAKAVEMIKQKNRTQIILTPEEQHLMHLWVVYLLFSSWIFKIL